jgi:glycosyltransferase involved in cell wall biosynthesis
MTQHGRKQARAELGLDPEELAILFVGGPAVHNRRAVRFLEEKLLPAIERPARLVIAGQCVPPRREGRVLALGYVKRLHLPLAAADVAVNPIEWGSGSNLKLAEYVAAGLPVVTTPLGLRGYEAFAPLVTATELDHFAEAVQTAGPVGVQQPGLDQLSWNALGRQLHKLYGDVIAERSGPR